MTLEAIPPRPTDPLRDPAAGLIAPRMSVGLSTIMVARRRDVFTVILPVPRLPSASAEGRRAHWRPGAVVPIVERWFFRMGKAPALIYQSDHPTADSPTPGTFWRQARFMPRRAVREAAHILTYERRPAPAEWMDAATAEAAGIVEVIVRHDSGRRYRRFCMMDTALHEADPDTSLLKRTAAGGFVADYSRRFGIGPATLRACDVWQARLIPFAYLPEENASNCD